MIIVYGMHNNSFHEKKMVFSNNIWPFTIQMYYLLFCWVRMIIVFYVIYHCIDEQHSDYLDLTRVHFNLVQGYVLVKFPDNTLLCTPLEAQRAEALPR